MSATSQSDPYGLIASLYLWGARCVGGILLVGIAIHVAKILTGTSSGVMGDLGNFWPNLVLIGLSAVPVVSLTIAGLAWVIRDRRDVTGWMAIVTALFLSSLWALK